MSVKRWEEIKAKKFSVEELRRIDREVQEELRPAATLTLEVPIEVIDAIRLPPGERQVPRHYSETDLEEDLRYAEGESNMRRP